jgi:hypothetical protein
MLDRVGLVTTRIALAGPQEAIDAYDALADMRVGLNVIDLHAVGAAGGPDAASVKDALKGVAATFERRISGVDDVRDQRLLTCIDQAIWDLASAAAPGGHPRGYAALVGLRRNLFPTAPPYTPPEAVAA